MTKSILITGASTGIGKATAELFAQKGWNVAATMRTPSKGADLAAHPNIEVIKLDVTNQTDINNAIQETLDKFGRIDVVLNNAGYGTMGPAEYAPTEEIQKLFDTHVMGTIHMTQAVLPTMRKQQEGIIFNVSSIGGTMTFPFISLYHSAKWAIEGFSESLGFELASHGVRVKILEPGAISTEFGANMYSHVGEGENPYTADFQKFMGQMQEMMNNTSTPDMVAQVVYDGVTDGTTQVRYLAGADAEQWFAQRREVGDEAFVAGIHQQVLGS